MAAIPDSVIIGDHATQPIKKGPSGGEPVLDKEGNYILPEPKNQPKSKSIFGYNQVSPIARLAAVAALDRPIPTAGQYGIDHVEPQNLEIPPECFLYDEDRPWVLGKLNPEACDLVEPAEPVQLSEATLAKLDALEQAAQAAAREANAEYYPLAEKVAPVAIKKVTIAVTDEKAESTVAEKIDAALKHAKPKSRNTSVSPSREAVRSNSGKSASPAPVGKSKTSKSPRRGVSPQSKIVASSGPKKIMNAKVDLEIVEKQKN